MDKWPREQETDINKNEADGIRMKIVERDDGVAANGFEFNE